MSKQDGLLQFKGAIENLSFYKTKRNGYSVRKKTGVSPQRVATDPRFARTRENGKEFGRACKAGKLIRMAFAGMLDGIADSEVSLRLNKQCHVALKEDKLNDRGFRNVMDGEAGLIAGFEFNTGKLFGDVFRPPFTHNLDRTAGTATIELAPFIPAAVVKGPPEATHYRLTIGAAALDFAAGTHDEAFAASESLVLDDKATAPVTLTASLPASSTVPLFLALSVEFFQMVNNKLYGLLSSGFNSMRMIAVSARP